MALETKYEQLYQKQEDVSGPPFDEIVQFAKKYPNQQASVLDLGCGQGRDALVFARQGMAVTGVDISKTGIQQMTTRARGENLDVTGVVADLREYTPDTRFDIIVLDRTLHMLSPMESRIEMLQRSADGLRDGGHLLIADERSNVAVFKDWFENNVRTWRVETKMKPSFCFAQLGGDAR